jgi:FAD/FMN-containing dehydrogenase
MVANNAGGEKTLTYGKVERYVASVRAVLSDGNVYEFREISRQELEKKLSSGNAEGALYRNIYTLLREHSKDITDARPKVSKNSAGYYLWNVWNKERDVFNLAQLIVGSQGTLGFITSITFRLVRPKRHSKLLVIFLRDTKTLAELVNTVLRFRPESFESYDDKTLRLVGRYFLTFMRQMGIHNLFQLVFSFAPEARVTLRKGFPRLVLLAEFTGDRRVEVEQRAESAEEAVRSLGLGTHMVQDNNEARKYWTIRREAFNLLRHHLKGERSVPFIDDVIVRPEKLPLFLPRLYAILAPHSTELRYAVGGHSGDGNFHIYTILDMHRPKTRELISEITTRVYSVVLSLGGSITAEHNDGLIRSPYLRYMYGEHMYELFEQVKYIFDPQGIFNPGKKVAGSWDFALRHLRTS